MSKSGDSLFSQHEHALEKEHSVCPECGGELSIKRGKSGAFIGCNSYPNCQYTRPLVEQKKVEDRVLTGSECPKCGHELAVKHGRYGMFIGCTNYPQCQHIEHQENETLKEINCPSCQSGQLQERNSRQGKTFYACNAYPKCKFAVNHQPVAGECSTCGFALLVKRHMAAGEKLQCANKKCGKFQ
ncbi:MAG: topoisomerase DNA-binding C4 zinc finger domain-containing protein [Cognaticolwellia aestuarii]